MSMSPVGSYAEGRIREFSLRTVVPINGRQRIVVQGAQGSEHVIGADVSEDLPVVCGADPTSPELPAEFLHKRGERYVLMGPGRSGSGHGSARRTTLVA